MTLQNSSILALNYYANLTCQYFVDYPRMYKIQSSTNFRLYFLQNKMPPPSQTCCISNTTRLFERLRNTTNSMITISVTKPRCLLMDNDNLLVTIEQTSLAPSYLDRFNPTNLTRQEHISIDTKVTNLAYFNSRYYIGIDMNQTISVFTHDNTSNALKFINNINTNSALAMADVRDMIFLDNGQTMIVASSANKLLFFFSLINNTNYMMQYTIQLNYTTPHGLYRVNYSFFYVVSWNSNSVYEYHYNQTTSNWTEKLFVNAGSHIMIDDCNRRWLTVFGYGIRVYDEYGNNFENWNLGSGYFDSLLLENDVVILSNQAQSTITRLDPQITCDDN